MKKNMVMFFQAIIVLIGIGALAILLWEPHLEGRNAHATLMQIYFHDPFLAYAYIASIAFFVALIHAFKLLRCAGQHTFFSQQAVKSVQTIKNCARMLIGFISLPVVYLFIVRPDDDIAGGVVIGSFLIAVFAIIAALTAKYEKHLQYVINSNSKKMTQS